MSILLEALRKSEKDQKQPDVPDIHADDASGRQTERIQTGPLAVLLVLALFRPHSLNLSLLIQLHRKR